MKQNDTTKTAAFEGNVVHHCVKSVQILNFFLVYSPEKNPYTDNFYAVHS